jgi:hypothetical protein
MVQRGSIGRALCLVLVVGMALWPAIASVSAGALTRKSASRIGGAQARVDWRKISLGCSYGCQVTHLDQGDTLRFNECFACNCVTGAAETEGEYISADAQCDAARRAMAQGARR